VTRWAIAGALLLMPVLLVGGAAGYAASSAPAAQIPAVAAAAYQQAADAAPQYFDGCRLPAAVLAGIGWVESRHAAAATLTDDGDTSPAILGPRLDGTGDTRAIADTDGGELDGDTEWDRAVGPMQFIPSTWRRLGQDGNDEGTADPHNYFDAALAAAAHLCLAPPPASVGKDLTDPEQLIAALYAYNRSSDYVAQVLAAIAAYAPAPPTLGAGGYRLPVDARLLTPELLARPHHDYPAWDLALPTGTTVHAIHAGTVAATTRLDSRCGLGLVVAGTDGFTYTYCHASTLYAAAGQQVAAGQPILAAGATGNASGSHLHLGMRRPDGALVCPQPLLLATYAGLPAAPHTLPTSGCTS